MAAVTYYSLFSNAVTVFSGFVTNTGSQCSSPATPVFPALAQLSTVNSLCTAGSPRYQASPTAMATNMQFAAGGFTSATVISAASWQIWIRKSATKQFWLEAYNSAGVKQAGGLGPVSVTGSSVMANAAFVGSLTVPANGFLVVRAGYTGGSNRFYFGQNPKSNGLPSAVLTTTQLPATTGPVAAASGSLGAIGGNAAGMIAPPVTRSVTVTLKDDAGALLPNQVCKVYSVGGVGATDVYVGSATSNGSGVITFQQTLPAASFVDLYFTGTYKPGAIEFTYRSELLTPA